MNAYWTGNKKAILGENDVLAKWGRIDHSEEVRTFVNMVFKFWYDARVNINSCKDVKHRCCMTRELENAGRVGFGTGMNDDLEEAFQHLSLNGGKWIDNETENYYYQSNNTFKIKSLVTAPESIVNFADHIDKKFTAVKMAMNYFKQRTQSLEYLIKNPTLNWKNIGTILSETSDLAGKAEPFLWGIPNLKPLTTKISSFANASSIVHSGMSLYKLSMKDNANVSVEIATQAMLAAVSYVPVLGGYYAGMIKMIPNMENWFDGVIKQRLRRLDAAARGRPI